MAEVMIVMIMRRFGKKRNDQGEEAKRSCRSASIHSYRWHSPVEIEIVSTTTGADSTHSGVEDRVHLGRVVRHYGKVLFVLLVDYTGRGS